MLTWRATLWYLQSFWSKYRRSILIGVGLGVAIVLLFPRIVVLLPQPKRTQHIGRVGLYSWADLPNDIQQKMSSGLTAVNAQGEPVAVLAQRWNVEEEGRVFRFLLKENLRWQDGKPLTPDDVKYTFSDVQTVWTENEVVFRLEDAYAPFPVVVSQPLYRQVQERRWGFVRATRLVGLGEYRVVEVSYNGPYVKQLTIENDRERLVYRFYTSEPEALTAYNLGRVDVLEQLTLKPAEEIKRTWLNSLSESINPRQFVAIFFNTAQPDLSREVRQALNYALQKPEANDELLRALSPIAPTSWAYNATTEVNDFLYNRERALEIWERVNPQAPLELNLDTSVALLPEAQEVANNWQSFGDFAKQQCEAGNIGGKDKGDCNRFTIKVNVQVARDLADFDAVLLAREVPADPDQYSWWHSDQAGNMSRYQNPRVDKLLEDARKETDQQKRKVLYFEFQRYLVEDVPAIFLYHMPEYRLERKNYL
jgi:peptide/nickel transport system substrate-binding protein